MKRAAQFMKIISEDHTIPVDEKYMLVALKIATLEERNKTMLEFGMVGESDKLERALMTLLSAVVAEFKEDEKNNKNRKRRRGWGRNR